MGREIQIIQLTRRPRDVQRFLNVSYGIYRNDPHWVAPLLFDLKQVFSDRNPFFEHAEMSLWVARRNGEDIGRIAGIVDRLHLEHQKDHAAYFGFFECPDDAEVSHRLFEAVQTWARQKHLQRILGPMNPSNNDECGLLVEGFDSSPVMMMPYNPPYYEKLVLAEGFEKAKNLLAYYMDLSTIPVDRLGQIADKFKRRNPNLTVRPIKRKTLTQDLARIQEVYNEAWQQNWGFVPMTDAEIRFMAQRLKSLLMEGLVWVTESATEAAGFLLAVPDFNEAIKPLRGRLLSPHLYKFLPYLFGWKVPRLARVIVLGVKAKYRGRGIESVMLAEGLRVGFQAGFQGSEASWVVEDNYRSRRMIEAFGAKPYKLYRLYARNL